MKSKFSGYYSPTAEQYERLWKEAIIVLDTNVLLNLYRLPTVARDELFTALALLKERLWIPHQVALEFQRRRLTVIASERKGIEDALTSASELVEGIKSKVVGLQLDKRGLGIESKTLLAKLEKANGELLSAIQNAHNAQLDISASDPIRERLDELLGKRVGPGPNSQEELNALVADGDDRFREKIPPGFADIDKDRNPNEATFIFDHIKYQRKFGDLILWRQLISHVKQSKIKAVLLITADRKEDWWWREQGKTVGPHPELIREIHRVGETELFWMYSSVQFVEHANKYSAATISTESVAEIKQVTLFHPTQSADSDTHKFYSSLGPADLSREALLPHVLKRNEIDDPEKYVKDWLLRSIEFIETNHWGFPDFLAKDNGKIHGYEVKALVNHNSALTSPGIERALSHGYQEIKEGNISGFTLIIVASRQEIFSMLKKYGKYHINTRLDKLLLEYPINSIILGVIIDKEFEPIIIRNNPDYQDD